MLTLKKEASMKYLDFNKAYAKEVAEGKKNTLLSDLLNIIHDKYKMIQIYPNLGKKIKNKRNTFSIELIGDWRMVYSVKSEIIEVLDFVNDKNLKKSRKQKS